MTQKGTQVKVFDQEPTLADIEQALTDFNRPREIIVSERLYDVLIESMPDVAKRMHTVRPETDDMLGNGYWLRAEIQTDAQFHDRILEASQLAEAMNLHLVVERSPLNTQPEYMVFGPGKGHKEPIAASLLLDEIEAWLENRARGRTFVTEPAPREARAQRLAQPTLPADPARVGSTSDPVQLTEERGNSYGAPEDNHAATSDFMAIWLRRKYGGIVPAKLDAEDTAAFNILQKLSRQANAPKDDNWHDIQGYAQNALDMPNHGRRAPIAPPGYRSPIVSDDDLAEVAKRSFARGVLHVRAAQEEFEARGGAPIESDATGELAPPLGAVPQGDGDPGDVR